MQAEANTLFKAFMSRLARSFSRSALIDMNEFRVLGNVMDFVNDGLNYWVCEEMGDALDAMSNEYVDFEITMKEQEAYQSVLLTIREYIEESGSDEFWCVMERLSMCYLWFNNAHKENVMDVIMRDLMELRGEEWDESNWEEEEDEEAEFNPNIDIPPCA